MKYIRTGINAQGQSAVVRREELGGKRLRELWRTEEPPHFSADVLGIPTSDLMCPPGLTRWLILTVPPNEVSEFHRTETMDLEVVLSGSCELVLEAETVPLEAGDVVMVAGVSHGWKAGPDGFMLEVVLMGATVADG
ncbi:MAG TPA: cupin domain-containing protein [Dehalococcoidia bacterium]|nr:cupin domain-containing protein [Dehalococcoidia bacterium]